MCSLRNKVGNSNQMVRTTMTYWESDRFILGSTYVTEGNDSQYEVCGRTHISDKVELELI